jgi:hypothetical protein
VKGKGVTYAQLVDKLDTIGVDEMGVNIRNKLTRQKFSASYFGPMVRTRNLFVTALVGLALQPICEWSYAQSSTLQQKENVQQAAPVVAAPDLTPLNDSLKAIEKHLESMKPGPETADEYRRAEGDLKAQNDMAVWAERMAYITLASVVMSALGVGLLIVTLRQNKVAMRIALAGVKSASQSVRVTKQTGERQLRAYVFLSDKDAFQQVTFEAGKPPFGIINIKNFGQTPAYNIQLQRGSFCAPWPMPDDFNLPDENFDADAGGATLAPASETLFLIYPEGPSVDTSIVDLVRVGKSTFYLWGRIRYTDAFEKVRTTEFCVGSDPLCADPFTPVRHSHRYNRAD